MSAPALEATVNSQPVERCYDFSNKTLLGQGQFGKVWRVQKMGSDECFACKEMLIPKNKMERTMREVETMGKLLEYFVVKEPRDRVKLYLIQAPAARGRAASRGQDLCEGDTLLKYLMLPKTQLTEQDCKDIFGRIIFAMHYLHSINIAHRDLKPDNLMLTVPNDPMTVKLGDFGFAKEFEPAAPSNTTTQLGTYGYVATEVMTSGEYDAKAADLFSMGVVLYELLSKRPPWELGRNAKPSAWNAKPDATKFPAKFGFDKISAPAKELVKKLLTMDPKARLTAEQVAAARAIAQWSGQVLWHPWMTDAQGVAAFRANRKQPVASSGGGGGVKPATKNNNAGDDGGCCLVM